MNRLKFSLALLFAFAASIFSFAHDFEVDGIYYRFIYDGVRFNASVTYRGSSYDDYYNEYSGDLVIPSNVKYEGKIYSVTSIGFETFRGCSRLTTVTIPNSVTSIGDYAFYYCSGLTSVTIPNSVNSIGDYTFYECIGLTSVTIPNSVTSIGNSAFYDCRGLTSVTIPNSVNSIDFGAFSGCSGLTSIVVAKENTFYDSRDNCNAIIETKSNTLIAGCENTLIPESVTSIGDYAFYECGIKSLTIPTSITSIGNHQTQPVKTIWLTNTPPNGYSSLSGITNYVSNKKYTSLSSCKIYPFLSSIFDVDGVRYVPVSPSEKTCDAIDCLYSDREKTININKTVNYKGIDLSVENINDYCFYKNDYIENVSCNINNLIGDYCFSNCTNIQTISLISGGSIGAYSFANCYNISELNMTCQTVSNYAFANCYNISELNMTCQTVSNYAFINSMNKQKAIANVTAKKIGDNVFEACSGLQQITLSKDLESIGSYSFIDCSALQGITTGHRTKCIM